MKLPIVSFMDRDTGRQKRWYDLKTSEWTQGLLAYNEAEYRVYIVTIDPSTVMPEAEEFTHTRWPRIMHSRYVRTLRKDIHS